jgi:hypothetical protein
MQVCESCVEHCGPAFHEQLAVCQFFKRIRQAVMEPDNPRVSHTAHTCFHSSIHKLHYLRKGSSRARLTAQPALQRDAQVFFKMIVLVEDWARALPYTVFTQALQNATDAGVALPFREEHDKAPRYDLVAYDQMRLLQAEQNSLRTRYSQRQRAQQQQQGDYSSLGATPPRVTPVCAPLSTKARMRCQLHAWCATGWPRALCGMQGDRRARYEQGSHGQVQEAALAALSEADRAAVLAAMSGTDQPPSQPGAAPGTAAGAEDLPKFDCQGSLDQLQVRAVAAHACAQPFAAA